MPQKNELSLEERVALLETRLADRETTMAFIAAVSSALSASVGGVRPLSNCEVNCMAAHPDNTEARLNCMLKCIADGKISIFPT
jgi:hypothetical protein